MTTTQQGDDFVDDFNIIEPVQAVINTSLTDCHTHFDTPRDYKTQESGLEALNSMSIQHGLEVRSNEDSDEGTSVQKHANTVLRKSDDGKEALIAVMGYDITEPVATTVNYILMRKQNDWIRENDFHLHGYWPLGFRDWSQPNFLSASPNPHHLQSYCTKADMYATGTRGIDVVETQIDGRMVHFVDTPGFSDTHLSDTEVLELIADYLQVAYKKEMKLSGIIYLHPISDTRVTHHTIKNLKMFQKLTGERHLKNVMLATSMWDKVTPEVGAMREQELKEKFWNLLLTLGAKAVRYGGTPEAARQLSATVLKNKPFYLQLQNEMVKDKKALRDTAAGKEVMAEVIRLREEHRREISEMESLMRSSASESRTVVKTLEEHQQAMLREVQKNLADERRMNEDAMRTLNQRIHDLEGRGHCAVI